MLSSNQELIVTGDLNIVNVRDFLEFALKLDGSLDNLKCNELKLGYQKTNNGKYVICTYRTSIPKYFKEYPFNYDSDIVASIIVQFLNEQEYILDGMWDSSYDKGFKMVAVPEWFGDEWEGIKNPFWGIVSFEKFVNFYSK